MGYGLTCAADVELILGTSSGFNVVRGTTVAGGTSTIYVGSATVSINSNTQGAMFYIAGSSSSNTDASLHIVNTSGTSTLYVRNDGRVGIGTTTPGTALYVIGTITATTGYIGDGSQLTGISATSIGANAVDSNQLVNTLNITDTTINVGSLTVSAGNFRVDSAGSTTVTTLTSTGSATVTGTLTAAGGLFTVNGNTGSMTASVVNAGTGNITTLSATNASVGSLTATTLTANGSITASTMSITGTATIATTSGRVGIGTTTPGTALYVIGTITATTGYIGDGSQLTGISATSIGANAVDSNQLVNTLNITDTTINVGSLTVSAGNFRVDSAGSMTATTITATGSTTASGTLTAANSTFRADAAHTYVTTRVGIGTTTPSSSYLLQVTNDSDTGVTIGSGGSMTAKTLAVTGTATITGTLTASNALRVNTNTLVVDATNGRVGIGTTTPATLLCVGTTTCILGVLTTGNVGIGTATPGTALYVIGTITTSRGIIFGDSTSQTTANYRNKVVLSSDVINNSSSVAAADAYIDVTGLLFGVNSGTTYRFFALIMYTSGATTTGSSWSINGSATTLLAYRSQYSLTSTSNTFNTANAFQLPAAANATSAFTTGNIAVIEGIIVPSVTGTVTVQFAREVAGGTITAKAGSTLEYW